MATYSYNFIKSALVVCFGKNTMASSPAAALAVTYFLSRPWDEKAITIIAQKFHPKNPTEFIRVIKNLVIDLEMHELMHAYMQKMCGIDLNRDFFNVHVR